MVDDPTARGGGGGGARSGGASLAGGRTAGGGGKSGPGRTAGGTSGSAASAADTAANRIGATGAPSPRDGPHKPNLDQMGPEIEAIPQGKSPGPRSTLGRPGMHGGKPRRR